MLGRVGSAAIALGLIVTLADGLAQERIEPALENQPIPEARQHGTAQDSQTEPRQGQAQTDYLVPALKAIEGAIRDLIAEEDTVERDREDQRQIADLQAQQDMAFWAKAMFWATAVAVALTFAGVLLIWRTLIHTRRAANAAWQAVEEAKIGTRAARDGAIATQKAADAAAETNELSRQVFILDRRPWLSIDSVGVRSGIDWDDNGARCAYQVIITNVGRTPAHLRGVYCQLLPSIVIQTAQGRGVGPDVAYNELLMSSISRQISPTIIFPERHIDRPVHAWLPSVHPDGPHRALDPVLIGCAIYTSMYEPNRLHTGFIFHVVRVVDGERCTIRPADGNILREQIKLAEINIAHTIMAT